MKSTWNVNGTIKVRHEFPEMIEAFGETVPLGGLTVRLSAREKILGVWGSWNSWGTTRTGSDGTFRFSKEKDQGKRQFKVEVEFKDEMLKLYPDNDSALQTALEALAGWNPILDVLEDSLEAVLENTSRAVFNVPWILIHSDRDAGLERSSGTTTINTMIFQSGGRQELGDGTYRRHAQIWDLYHRIFDLLDGLPGDVGFDPSRTLALKYPHRNDLIDDGVETPYANPQTNTIFVMDSSWYTLGTLIHELGHLLAYQRTSGELGMAWQLALHGSTHGGRQSQSFVAGQEGFAEYFYFQIYRTLFAGTAAAKATRNTVSSGGDPAGWYTRPLSRPYLAALGVADLADASHFEEAWISLFNLMTVNRLHEFDFDRESPYATRDGFIPFGRECESPELTLADVITVFNASPSAGFPLKFRNSDWTITNFLARARAVLPALDGATEGLMAALVDPQASLQPRDALCTAATLSAEPVEEIQMARPAAGRKPLTSRPATPGGLRPGSIEPLPSESPPSTPDRPTPRRRRR